MDIIKLWNLYADGDSQWDSLTEGEKLMFAMSLEREECSKVCIQMANRCDDIRKAALEVAAENIRARGTT